MPLQRALLVAAVVYSTWLGMMAVHEFGHVLHAWLSHGRVVRVSLPLAGFSQTIVDPNPHEHFVIWGGPMWGCLVPLMLFATARLSRWRRVLEPSRFFAGFCLVANGAYLGIGWTRHAGDAGDLIRLGTPPWILISFGVIAVAGGMFLWHRSPWLTFRR